MMVDAVERLVFIRTLCSGDCSFQDFQRYCSTSRAKRYELYPWMIDFLSRQFQLTQLKGSASNYPDYVDWPLRMKALYLWLYLPAGFERPAVKRCFHVETGELRHWCVVLERASLYVLDGWVGDSLPDHLMIQAFLFHVTSRYIHRLWKIFYSHLWIGDETIDSTIAIMHELKQDAASQAIEYPERQNDFDAGMRTRVAMKCSFEPAKSFFTRFLADDVITFKTMRALYRYDDVVMQQAHLPTDAEWITRWARRLDVACVLDMATPRQDRGGFRTKIILEATFLQKKDTEFWAALERAKLVTEESIRMLFDHLDRNVLGEMLPIEWRHREPWTTLIDQFMCKKRRRRRRRR